MPRRLVPSGRTGGSAFFDSMLSGQDVGESARGAARWAAPFFVSGEFDTGYIKSDVFYILFDVFEGVKKFYFAPY